MKPIIPNIMGPIKAIAKNMNAKKLLIGDGLIVVPFRVSALINNIRRLPVPYTFTLPDFDLSFKFAFPVSVLL